MRDLQRYPRSLVIALLITSSVIILDRVTKIFFSNLLDLGESLPVVDHVLHMTLVHNTGIAFGFLKDQNIVFILVPVIAIVLLVFNVYYYRQNGHAINSFYVIAFCLILGGALGNLFDRIVYGYVIDFIDLRIWPVFNIADSAITIGAILITWQCFRLAEK